MHRFFVPTGNIISDNVKLDGAVVHQIGNVLRARSGDRVVLLDNSGWEYTVILEKVSPHEVIGRVIEKLVATGEANVEITLYQAVLKSERFEFVLQKGTELGVTNFVPVLCARTVPKYREFEQLRNRYNRWQRIVSEAAEQSHRGKLPVLHPPIEFFTACNIVEDLAIIAWENEQMLGLRETLTKWKRVNSKNSFSIFTGPEGGFTVQEINIASDNGIVPVTLGRRILRAETAAITTVSAIMYEYGELGS